MGGGPRPLSLWDPLLFARHSDPSSLFRCFRVLPAGSGPLLCGLFWEEVCELSLGGRAGSEESKPLPPSLWRRCLWRWAEGLSCCLSTPQAGPAAGLVGLHRGLCTARPGSVLLPTLLPALHVLGRGPSQGDQLLRARPGAAQGSLGPGRPPAAVYLSPLLPLPSWELHPFPGERDAESGVWCSRPRGERGRGGS